jgi:hypothetical protein
MLITREASLQPMVLPWWARLLGVTMTALPALGTEDAAAVPRQRLIVVGTAVGPLVTSLDLRLGTAAPADDLSTVRRRTRVRSVGAVRRRLAA